MKASYLSKAAGSVHWTFMELGNALSTPVISYSLCLWLCVILKVLSSEMDPAKIRFIRQVVIKE
jgi:hypothetical protein